jgi:D-glycero-D-manno-heptose 1,7-bisphosphate phosphatase
MKRRAAFVDRDGTLNQMVYDADHGILDSPRRPNQVALAPHAASFLNGLRELGFVIIVVTNQPGLAKGTLTTPELDAVNARLAELLASDGSRWDELRYCPHHPDFGPACECRKPKPGLLLSAAADHGLDLARSWTIGDGLVDVGAARAAGTRSVLVTSLKLEVLERAIALDGCTPEVIAPDLSAALDIIRRERAGVSSPI